MKVAEFISAAKRIATKKTVYVWGTCGNPVTAELLDSLLSQYSAGEYKNVDKAKHADADYWGFDCSGLIKAILWGWSEDRTHWRGGSQYESNNCGDDSANNMIESCPNNTTDFTNIQPGECVWTSGHIGIYIGDGQVIESTPQWGNGVQITSCHNIGTTSANGRLWSRHGKLPFITYPEVVRSKDTYRPAGASLSTAQSAYARKESRLSPATPTKPVVGPVQLAKVPDTKDVLQNSRVFTKD